MATRSTANRPIDAFCTMATTECLHECALFVSALRRWHPSTPIYIAASPELIEAIFNTPPIAGSSGGVDMSSCSPLETLRFFSDSTHSLSSTSSSSSSSGSGLIEWVPSLAQYGIIRRDTMERQKGVWYPSRHADFMMEKASILEHAMMMESLKNTNKTNIRRGTATEGRPFVLFLDCDIVTLSPWPDVPEAAHVVLSPHNIDPSDEARWGTFNGGCVGTQSSQFLYEWRKYTKISRYHDQASLEDAQRAVVEESGLRDGVPGDVVHFFGDRVNYGYWRMFQQEANKDDDPRRGQLPKFSYKQISLPSSPSSSSLSTTTHDMICFGDAPLQSVHTHFTFPKSDRQLLNNPSAAMTLFNKTMIAWMKQSRSGAYGHIIRWLI